MLILHHSQPGSYANTFQKNTSHHNPQPQRTHLFVSLSSWCAWSTLDLGSNWHLGLLDPSREGWWANPPTGNGWHPWDARSLYLPYEFCHKKINHSRIGKYTVHPMDFSWCSLYSGRVVRYYMLKHSVKECPEVFWDLAYQWTTDKDFWGMFVLVMSEIHDFL